MEWIALAAGAALILAVLCDVIWTTLLMSGGGPLTARLTRLLWRVCLPEARLRERLEALAHRRSLPGGLVAATGWRWHDVAATREGPGPGR
jgi:hypothetical protein